jgi:hypothetical protein
MLCLLGHKFHASAFALARPMIEALVRAHLVLCSFWLGRRGEEDQAGPLQGELREGRSGSTRPSAVALFFENLLKGSRDLLHSLTHSGKAQLWRRFDGDQLGSGYTDGEIWGLLRTASIVEANEDGQRHPTSRNSTTRFQCKKGRFSGPSHLIRPACETAY